MQTVYLPHFQSLLLTINEHGEIQNSNPATEKLFGYAPEEIIHQKVNMLMPDHHARQHDQYLPQPITNQGTANVIGIGRGGAGAT